MSDPRNSLGTDDVMREYEAALAKQAEALFEHAKAENVVKLVEMKIRRDIAANAAPPMTETERFISENRPHLEGVDLKFLEERTRSVSEVAAYLNLSANSVKRRIHDGTFEEDKKRGGARYAIKPVSVVRSVIENR